MLNTKPIKNNSNNNYTINNSLNSDKNIKIENSKQKELENLVLKTNIENFNESNKNDNYDSYKNNMMAEHFNSKINNDSINNNLIKSDTLLNPKIINEFNNSKLDNTNLNLGNIIEGNKYNSLRIEDDSDINNFKILDKPFKMDNNTNTNTNSNVKWDSNNNNYVIYNNNNIECVITNNDILKYILNDDYNNIFIKKYIFIITLNNTTNNNEFNFIDSIFTGNFDIMVKLQNFIYETLNNYNDLIESDKYNYYEIITFFYYQLIIWLFKNSSKFDNINDDNKVSKFFSVIIFRLNTIILKNLVNIKKKINDNNILLNKLTEIKDDINSKLNTINIKLNNFSLDSDNIFDSNKQSSETSKSSDTSESSDSSTFNNNITDNITGKETDINSSDIINKYKIVQKNGKKVDKIFDIITDDSNYDSDNNSYKEINDTITNQNFSNLDKIKLLENKINSIETTNNKISYNPNSADKNGKLFKINI
jgi:hypothetical protein